MTEWCGTTNSVMTVRAVERCDAPLRRHRQISSFWYLQH
jgi:hypothetical protein